MYIGKELLKTYFTNKYSCVGDVRGLGGMVGIEFVNDRATKEPATAQSPTVIAAF